jgi:hypothetical protein
MQTLFTPTMYVARRNSHSYIANNFGSVGRSTICTYIPTYVHTYVHTYIPTWWRDFEMKRVFITEINFLFLFPFKSYHSKPEI